MADLVLKNAQLVSSLGVTSAGVAIKEGKIIAVGGDNELPSAQEEIDCKGMLLFPGVFDPHV
ncbi:MAG TPA: amidohydrolase, partial [Dehalococcoidia bacterium]|nr:amidohydrolase [Dehalococcoidia bacterium]